VITAVTKIFFIQITHLNCHTLCYVILINSVLTIAILTAYVYFASKFLYVSLYRISIIIIIITISIGVMVFNKF